MHAIVKCQMQTTLRGVLIATEEQAQTGTRWKIPNKEIKPGAESGLGKLNGLAASTPDLGGRS
jgi:hypothetical protein